MKRDRGLWVLLTLFPFGWGNWAAFLWAGQKAGVKRWKLYSPLYALLAALPWIFDAALPEDPGDALAGVTLICGWGGGIVHSLVARPSYMRIVGDSLADTREAAEARLRERREALQVAQENPELAREMGIGKPGGPGGLVDVNSAQPLALRRLPGIDAATAQRIVALRAEVGEFSSLAELGMTAELDAAVVEDLRGRVVFL
jgi:helix-hairpin-helix protein